MAASVTGTFKLSVNGNQVPDTGFLSGQALSAARTLSTNFASSGSAADQVQKMYATTLSFTASTPQTIDLQAVTDILGAALSFSIVRSILIRHKGTVDGSSLSLSAGASNGATNILATTAALKILPATSSNDGWFALAAPNTTGYVIDATHKTLTLTPSAHAFDVDIIALGA